MAKVSIDVNQEREISLEIGDIVVTEVLGARMIVKHDGIFYAVDLMDGSIGGEYESIEALRKIYCIHAGKYRIIKSINIEVIEVGETE